MRMTRRRSAVLAIVAGGAVLACSIQRPVTVHAVAYNEAIARSHDQIALLNVVRTMMRFPQQYTDLSELRGQASAGLTPSISLEWPEGGGDGKLTSGLGASVSAGTSLLTVANLEDEKFVRAISNPITLAQFDYFQAQAWPERVLGLLFIQRFEILEDDWDDPLEKCEKTTHEGFATRAELEPERIRELTGKLPKPGAKKSYAYFNEVQEWLVDPFAQVSCFSARLLDLRYNRGLRIEGSPATDVGPSFLAMGIDLAEAILDVRAAGLELVQLEGKQRFQIRKPGAKRLTWTREVVGGQGRTKTISLYAEGQSTEQRRDRRDQPAKAKLGGQFVLRSPASVIYYLGEIMRGQAKLIEPDKPVTRSPEERAEVQPIQTPVTSIEQLQPAICDLYKESEQAGTVVPIEERECQQWNRLFVAVSEEHAKRLGRDKDPLVDVKWRGASWLVPACSTEVSGDLTDCHRSMQVLTIVKQLFGLNRERKSLPTTGVVTLAGG